MLEVVVVGLRILLEVLVQAGLAVVVKVEPTSMKTDTQVQQILEVVAAEQAVAEPGRHIQIPQGEQGVQVLWLSLIRQFVKLVLEVQ
jgi:hypothetical protein